MAVKNFNQTSPAEVTTGTAGATVNLSIIIGDAQAGGSSLMLNGTILPNQEPVSTMALGSDTALKNQILMTTTTIRDIQNSMKSCVTVNFDQEGLATQSFSYTLDLDSPGDTAVYTLFFCFS
jgi:hypothetical protein